MTIEEYIKGIVGTSGAMGQLRTSVNKAFQSPSFRLFWRNWNPLVGYFLSKNVNRPVARKLNGVISSLLTFLFSGLILHDIWIMPLFYIFLDKVVFFPVTFIFFCFWFVMIAENLIKFRENVTNTTIHVLINIIYVIGCSVLGGLISSVI